MKIQMRPGERLVLPFLLASLLTVDALAEMPQEAAIAEAVDAGAEVLASEAQEAEPIPPAKPEFTRTLRSITEDALVGRGLVTGVYRGSPKVLADPEKYEREYYSTLASHRGKPIPQAPPPPCDQPQRTKYDTEGCRIVNSMYTDVEDPVLREKYRETIRRGRDVWFKGTFGNQEYFALHVGNGLFGEPRYPDQSHWLDTRKREDRYRLWGMMNDPDCEKGDESTYWTDRCKDPHSSGVIGLRKYVNQNPPEGFDPYRTPYQPGELADSRRFVIGQACAVCHAAFDPTHPPADPTHPEWENLTGHIGNQYTNNTNQFFGNLPADHFAKIMYQGIEVGQVDTTSGHMDFVYNPGTQNNITDFQNRPVFEEKIKHPITGEVSMAKTRHVLKGGEDSVGEKLSLLRVYLNIGMCFAECTADKFPKPGAMFGEDAIHKPFRIKQCYQDCEPWNQADAKMDDMALYLLAGGPFYLRDAVDVDGRKGEEYIEEARVPAGRRVYARECAVCHSSRVPPDAIRSNKDALEQFYSGHVFGREQDWMRELGADVVNAERFQAKHVRDGRPAQFVRDEVFGQDWLGNDELVAHNILGVNRCRSMHGNQVSGAVWEEFSSETYKERPAPAGEYPKTLNPLLPLVGGKQWWGGNEEINGGRGYYRNVSLLSIWAHAPFLHNNTLGHLRKRPDGGIDYTVRGRIIMFEDAMAELLTSDDLTVEPHREPKITRVPVDTALPMKLGGKPFIPVAAGTPIVEITSIDPHAPTHMTCADYVENKGHQFGVDLHIEDKRSLIEFLKTL